MTQDDEDQQLRSLLGVLSVVGEWEGLTGGPACPARGALESSDLAGGDTSMHPYGVSHAAWATTLAAVSHLGCLPDSLFVKTSPGAFEARLHTHGQFTLVRRALEDASRAG